MTKRFAAFFALLLLAASLFAQYPASIQIYSGNDIGGQPCNPFPMSNPNPPIRYNQTTGNYFGCSTNSSGATPSNPLWTAVTVATGTTGTGTMVLSTSPTLTTPNVANPVITGPAPVACGATCTASSGQLILLNLAAGSTVTIPTSSGSGNVIRMRVTTTTTSAQEKVLLATVTDAIIGTAIGENAGTAKVFVGNASTYHSIQMPFTGSQPSGGFAGDTITCTDIAAGTWACDVVYEAGTTPTTPYSASTT